jgi:hypothetical protein
LFSSTNNLQSAAWESAELEELTAVDEGVGSISTFMELSLPGERLLFLLGVLQWLTSKSGIRSERFPRGYGEEGRNKRSSLDQLVETGAKRHFVAIEVDGQTIKVGFRG